MALGFDGGPKHVRMCEWAVLSVPSPWLVDVASQKARSVHKRDLGPVK
jgi:hypothetical protein